MVGAPHPRSVIGAADGRQVQLKVHQCFWSGDHPGNSLAAVQECFAAHVARAEIDVAMLCDADFLVVHDVDLAVATTGVGRVDETTRRDAQRLCFKHDGHVLDSRPPLLSEVVAMIAAEPFPTLLEIDLKDRKPWPWPRVEELASMLQPVQDRVTFGGGADWNLRRLHHVATELRMGFTITDYLDWLPSSLDDQRPRNAYGYVDAHPLGDQRVGSTRDYLWDRLGALVRLVPDVRDIHIRLVAGQQMAADGLVDLADMLHRQGMLLDLWTLNAGQPGWREQLQAALDLGADVITTETPRALSEAALDA
jgi:glycerophosphoryl diester phosphodiesterase